MKEQELDLCVILKGHEGETFYSPIFGNIKLQSIHETVFFITNRDIVVSFISDGKYISGYKNAECLLFPSKNQRDWNKWIAQQTPKTWDQYIKQNKNAGYMISYVNKDETENTPISAAFALLEINKLIKIGYGGNITKEEWENTTNCKYTIICGCNGELYIASTINRSHIAFHSEEQAKEFISYPENIQLIKDFFMM